MPIYRGFSSHQFTEDKQFSTTDIELVKTDLIAHIFTPRGSRVMMPTFGTILPDILFEPLDEITTQLVEDELRSVFEFDPRVEILDFSMQVNADAHAIEAQISLFYIELNLEDNLILNLVFEN